MEGYLEKGLRPPCLRTTSRQCRWANLDVLRPDTGELDGQNIPVRAGPYRARFNIRTFEYVFEFNAPAAAETCRSPR
jgi:hypothetical protein